MISTNKYMYLCKNRLLDFVSNSSWNVPIDNYRPPPYNETDNLYLIITCISIVILPKDCSYI